MATRPSHAQDRERLKVLSIFHFIVAGLVLALSLFSLIFVAIGGAVLLDPASLGTTDNDPPAALAGVIFLVIGAAFLLYGFILAVALVLSGRWLRQQKHYWYSVVIACVALLFTPIGTVLGLITLVILLQDSVRELYGVNTETTPPT
ncbi:hypothetical protein [Nodosilinea sp. P-1105]|uniref:hypothetical protein n=1 Tax=Nodosilinea sp. P-1105 TaxID=2546229 RepID=UPI00146B2965|nr:hypothetical protein [Nodosilinea sp. P-1105]NMF86263.1 hypothetical protein [Nodosilinea sp. P-1105]